ncbi:MAG: DUF6273 domain-containing protein [Clostridia bacterium]
MKKKIVHIIAVFMLTAVLMTACVACGNKDVDKKAPVSRSVTIGSLVGGKVVADKATATAGEVVTLTVSATGGYHFIDGTLTANGVAVPLKDGKYTFKMPYTDVTILAQFKKVYTRVDSDRVENENGRYLLFGEYPQSLASDDVSENFKKAIKDNKLEAMKDSDGYYVSTVDGERYAMATATKQNNREMFTDGVSQIFNGTSYFFKVEPIKWLILKEQNGQATLLAADILDTHIFDSMKGDWEKSSVRAFLNGDLFLNKAFNASLKESIVETTLDNRTTSWSTENAKNLKDTLDKVFLPSYKDMAKVKSTEDNEYGFPMENVKSAERKRLATDFSRARGAWIDTAETNYGVAPWWLRSIGNDADGKNVINVSKEGCVSGQYNGYAAPVEGLGIVPMLTLTM